MSSVGPDAKILTPSSTPPPGTPRQRTFRPDIEGLRAVAVVMVLLNHAGWTALGGGFVGVDVFFVLSGFLITGLLIREVERTGTVSLPQFYARRARRLLPAGTLVLLATVLASYAWLGEHRANSVADDARWAALFAANLRFISQGTDYLGAQAPPSPLQHYWSLAVEEQFYFVWPILIMLVAIIGRRWPLRPKLGVALTGIILASLAWSVHQTTVDGTTAYFSPFTRASELAIGALLAVVAPLLPRLPRVSGIAMSWLGVALIGVSAFVIGPTTPFPGLAALAPVLGTALAIAGGTTAPGGGAEVVLKRWPLQWLGKLSYSLYLWHWPLLVLAAGRAGHDLALAENLMICLVALALAAATYALLENPLRSARVLRERAPAISVAFGLALVLLSTSVSTWYVEAHREPAPIELDEAEVAQFPTAAEVEQAVIEGTQVSEWPEQPPRLKNPAYEGECDVARKDTTSAACVFGNPDAKQTVVVFGDSHGTMWIPAFDEIGRQADWRVVQLTKPGCPAADFANYSTSLGREYTECAEFREFAFGTIAELRPDVVVVTGARKGVIVSDTGEPNSDDTAVDAAWEQGLATSLDRMQPHADRLIVLGDIAYADEPGLDCLSANPDDVEACNVPRDEAVLADHNAMERRVAAAHGADYVDLIPYFCTETTCPAVIGNLTTRRDTLHVAENYALWLSGALGEATGLAPDRSASAS
ncbi:MAG TPA: acyltransferase family protein [Thermomicrobiales bacterium]|nr:acyltransferase family protein [Thermomicrobiales bacterium]